MIKCEKISECRVCGSGRLIPVINLGDQYLSSIFPTNLSYRDKLEKYPLNCVLCDNCKLLQLSHVYDLSEMYLTYPYSSSIGGMIYELEDIAKNAKQYVEINEGDVILDVGGNSGQLLSFFQDTDATLINIDAAQVPPCFESEKFINIQNTYFSKEEYFKHTNKKAKLANSICMLYHLHDPKKLVCDVSECLADDGIYIVQMASLRAQNKKLMVDNILAEHNCYFCLNTLKFLVEDTDLEIFDVSENEVYNGSFRIAFKKRSNNKLSITPNVETMLQNEINEGIFDLSTYRKFNSDWARQAEELRQLVKEINDNGGKLAIIGASTKGSIILQSAQIDYPEIFAAGEIYDWKLNKFMIDSDIPIRKESEVLEEATHLLILIYGFAKQIIKKNIQWIENGGEFIIPLPTIRRIDKNNYKEYLE